MADYISSQPVGTELSVAQSDPSKLKAEVQPNGGGSFPIKADSLANQTDPLKVNLRDGSNSELVGQKTKAESVPVTIASDQGAIDVNVVSSTATSPVNDYNTTVDLASGSEANHDYTVPAGKTLHLSYILASASIF